MTAPTFLGLSFLSSQSRYCYTFVGMLSKTRAVYVDRSKALSAHERADLLSKILPVFEGRRTNTKIDWNLRQEIDEAVNGPRSEHGFYRRNYDVKFVNIPKNGGDRFLATDGNRLWKSDEAFESYSDPYA